MRTQFKLDGLYIITNVYPNPATPYPRVFTSIEEAEAVNKTISMSKGIITPVFINDQK